MQPLDLFICICDALAPPPLLLSSSFFLCLKLLSTLQDGIHDWHREVLKPRLTPPRKWLPLSAHIPLLTTRLEPGDTEEFLAAKDKERQQFNFQ